jgi:hypothetical protein
MFSNVPCTRITGYGWAALGAQSSFAPGGGVFGALTPAANPVAKL